jgi:predicted DNA binding CopG/RHH family protein
MSKAELKQMPPLGTDEEAELFVETADLSEYDLSVFKPTRFEFARKTTGFHMRVPPKLLDAVRRKAESRGVPISRYVRMLMEEDVSRP